MAPVLPTLLACVFAYLLGSVPFGLLVGFLHGVDIRDTGSGNIGATNLARTVGKKWGYVAFLLDFAKGCGPVIAVRSLAHEYPERFLLTAHGWLYILVGFAAIIGHVFPVYLRFRGGKGVATAFGVVAALAWKSTFIAGVIWLIPYLLTRIVSVASLAAAAGLPVAVAVLKEGEASDSYVSVQVLTVACAVLITWRHRSNIARLLRGDEFRFRPAEGNEEKERNPAPPPTDSKT